MDTRRDCFADAIVSRTPKPGLIHHSDRGIKADPTGGCNTSAKKVTMKSKKRRSINVHGVKLFRREDYQAGLAESRERSATCHQASLEIFFNFTPLSFPMSASAQSTHSCQFRLTTSIQSLVSSLEALYFEYERRSDGILLTHNTGSSSSRKLKNAYF